jgi:hypothetical protein
MLRYVDRSALEPEDLAVLQRVFDQLTAELHPDLYDPVDIAAAVLRKFQGAFVRKPTCLRRCGQLASLGSDLGTFDGTVGSRSGRETSMPDEPKPHDPKAEFVRKVARETGISEAAVRDLISMVGFDYNSILREAREMKRQGGHST